MALNLLRWFLFFLASTMTVEALECVSKVETVCKPKGPTCETLETQLLVQGEAKINCTREQNVCVSISAHSTGKGINVDTTVAGCLVEVQNYGVGCYETKRDMSEIDSNTAKNLADAETQLGIKYDAVKICLCKGDLCNKATKAALSGATSSAFNLPIIITSILITFVALREQMQGV